MTIKKFTIDRGKWRSGGELLTPFKTGEGRTELLNTEGYMCCLGFFSLACGFKPYEIYECATPTPEDDRFPQWFRFYDLVVDDLVVENLMEINDDTCMSREKREHLLTKRFAEYGVEVEFVGDYE